MRYEEKPESVEPVSSQAAQDPICPSLHPRGWLLVACRVPNPDPPALPMLSQALTNGVSEIRAWAGWEKSDVWQAGRRAGEDALCLDWFVQKHQRHLVKAARPLEALPLSHVQSAI